jgi:hypothetical protein
MAVREKSEMKNRAQGPAHARDNAYSHPLVLLMRVKPTL